MLIQGKILSCGCDLSEVFKIRKEVFVEELHIPEEVEFDDLDSIAMHVIVYEEAGSKNTVATGRIFFDGTICEIGHICVRKEFRGKKYGDFAVRMLINKAFVSGIPEVCCNVSGDVIEFFQKIGFRKDDKITEINQSKCYPMIIHDSDIVRACSK